MNRIAHTLTATDTWDDTMCRQARDHTNSAQRELAKLPGGYRPVRETVPSHAIPTHCRQRSSAMSFPALILGALIMGFVWCLATEGL